MERRLTGATYLDCTHVHHIISINFLGAFIFIEFHGFNCFDAFLLGAHFTTWRRLKSIAYIQTAWSNGLLISADQMESHLIAYTCTALHQITCTLSIARLH